MKIQFKKIINNIIEILKRPDMSILPGQLAYFFILTIIPTLTIVSYITSLFSISLEDIIIYFNLNSNSIIATIIKSVLEESNINVGIIVLLLFGLLIISNGMNSIIITANNIYGIKERSFKIRRIKALLMAIILILLFLFITVFPVLGNFILSLIEKITGYNEIYNIINIFRWPLSWLVIFLFIKVLYILAPDKKVLPESTNAGSLFTSIGWIISTEIYLNYAENFADYSILYSNLANIAILMMWMYILAYIFVVGLAINTKDEYKFKFNHNLIHKHNIEPKNWYEE